VLVVRVKNRVYNDDGRLVSHAEYAVVDGDRQLARLVLNRRAWVAVEASDGNGFGKPVSPMNLTLFRDVRKWALEKWGGK
jgi:hypothetical protein